jgi:hypothetical protein
MGLWGWGHVFVPICFCAYILHSHPFASRTDGASEWATRTTAPPKLNAKQAAFRAKVEALAPKYRTELLERRSGV